MNLIIWALNRVQIVWVFLFMYLGINESKPQFGGVTCGRNNVDWWQLSGGVKTDGKGGFLIPSLLLEWGLNEIGVHIIMLYAFFCGKMSQNKTNL